MSAQDALVGLGIDAALGLVGKIADALDVAPWTDEVVDPKARAFCEHMLGRYGARLHRKDALPMRAVAAAFDVAHLFGDDSLPTGEAFMQRFATTIGADIYVPASVLAGDPRVLVEVLTHECEHVAQFRAAGFAMPWLYLTEGERRASLEADAYGAGLAVRHAMGAPMPATVDDLAPSLASAYHLDEHDVDLATDMLRSHAASVASGVVATDAARAAVEWLRINAPEWATW